jgi:hypothetical protein
MASRSDQARAPGRRLAAGLLIAVFAAPGGPAAATESVTIRMYLNNLQAKAIRDAEGQPVTIRLTTEQKALVRVRSPRFKGHIIRAAAHQIGAANKISLTIFKPDSNTPVLRVADRAAPPAVERSPDAAARAELKKIRVELGHLHEKILAFEDRLALIEKLLRAE